MRRRWAVVVTVAVASLALGCPPAATPSGRCPSGMALVEGPRQRAFCIDRFEAHVVELRSNDEIPHSPYEPVAGLRVKAVSKEGVVPQAYISKLEAEAACKNANKRLCSGDEWSRACRGASGRKFPYGDARESGRCNDSGRAPLAKLHPGEDVFSSAQAMNDPRINQAPNTVAKTGSFSRCESEDGVHDMVGNLHEWTANRGGTFRGGYYLDTHINGEGCGYQTTGHNTKYSDYSIGFRCCSRPGGEPTPKKLRSPIPAGSPRALDFERKKRERARKRAAGKAP